MNDQPSPHPGPVVDREALLALFQDQQVGASIPAPLLAAYRRTLAEAVLALLPTEEGAEQLEREIGETAIRLGYELGRKEALTEAAGLIEGHYGPDPSPASPTWWDGYTEAQRDCGQMVRNLISQPSGAASEPRTAPAGHTGLPEDATAVSKGLPGDGE